MGTKSTTTAHLKIPNKPKRHKVKETTVSPSSSSVSAAASASGGSDSTTRRFSRVKLERLIAVSEANHSRRNSRPDPDLRGSFSPAMDFAAENNGNTSSFTKFNSVLTAGLLNPMSPPPAPAVPPNRSSPTLFEMIGTDQDVHRIRSPHSRPHHGGSSPGSKTAGNIVVSSQEKEAQTRNRVSDLLASRSPGNLFNDQDSSDVNLTLSSKDGIGISVNVHRQILVVNSRFFAARLSNRRSNQQTPASSPPWVVEIADCDDVEVYIETLSLMYCKDIRKKLMRRNVPRILAILKVSAAIGFDAGVLSCLEYLEAAPWTEDEDVKVASLLSELQLENVGSDQVLSRIQGNFSSNNEQILLKLLHVVLDGKDEKARQEMKTLISKLLRQSSSSKDDFTKELFYSACDRCLQSLNRTFTRSDDPDSTNAGQIARQAGNLAWLLDILIDRQIADEFLATWAAQTEMAKAHGGISVVHRHEVSSITARLFIGIGKGRLLAPKDVRYLLLKTWLVPFYDDFRWMKRASRGLDRYLIEECLSNTVLTLPLVWQQEIFMDWFDRFLDSGDDCPNLQRGFQVWWRRAFPKQNRIKNNLPK